MFAMFAPITISVRDGTGTYTNVKGGVKIFVTCKDNEVSQDKTLVIISLQKRSHFEVACA